MALKRNRPRAGAPATGLVVLLIRTTDQDDQPVLDFWRCPMLPLHDPDMRTGHAEALDASPADLNRAALRAAAPTGWRLEALRARAGGPAAADLAPGAVLEIEGGETVTAAPELARLTLNIATAHTDATGSAHGQRLVYGGHTISIASAHVTRALPRLATILAWAGCDHPGPVFEGNVLHTELRVEGVEPTADGDWSTRGRWFPRIARMMRRRPSWTGASWRWWPERAMRGGPR